MTHDSVDKYFNPDQYSINENPVRNKMMEDAAMLASLLVDRGNVKKVGIAGSLAKGKENPSDIDFIIFIDNETAKACHREKMRLVMEKSDKKIQLSKYLKLDDQDWNWFVAVYSATESPIDIQIVSDQPDEEYIRMMARDNIDPNFLKNISDDVLLYDRSDDTFKKKAVFDDRQAEMMVEAGYQRIKEILEKPDDRYYDMVANSYSHKKRINRGKDNDPNAERGNSRMEIAAKEKVDEARRRNYRDLIDTFDKDPFSLETWAKVVELAKSESLTDDGSASYYFEDLTQENFYEHVPLRDLIDVGERLREAKSREDRYKILMEKNSGGELWYDVILGHVNNKMFEPVIAEITASNYKFLRGLDVGCGSGNSLKMMAPLCEKCVGLDKLDISLDAAKSNGLPENVTLVKGSVVQLPFDDGNFDVVTSNGLTCYLSTPEVKDYVGEINRVLERGGSYFETVATIKKDQVLPGFEADYLSSAKTVLVCLLDRICSNIDDIKTTENTITVLLDQFKKLGYSIRFSGFNQNDLGVLEFIKK